MSNAAERVTEYLRQFNRLRDTGGTVHVVHTDPESEAVSLTSADLEAVLAQAKVEQEEMTVYGYVVVDREGKFIKNADSQQQAIDFATDATDSCKAAGIDWDYRVAAIVDQGGL